MSSQRSSSTCASYLRGDAELRSFDFGAPTVWRICVDRPDLFVAIISQNGNAFEAGLSDEFWAPVRKMWAGPRDAIDPTDILALDWVSMQYKTGEPDPDAIPPERASTAWRPLISQNTGSTTL